MSTGTSGAIKAGAAYVQAWLDDNPLTQGLAKLQTKLRTWQGQLSAMGAKAYGGELPEPFAAIARFAASPAGAFSALLGAAKLTGDARDEMGRFADVTGVGVEKLSALAYAAKRADVSTESLINGLRKMQSKEFQMAMQGIGGKGGKPNFAAALGLGHGDAADQLRQVVKQFEGLDATSRAGLARKLGISELMPLLAGGVEQLDAFIDRAHKLGLVMSEEDAKSGERFDAAFKDLHAVIMSGVKAIGGALVPVITGLTNAIVPIIVHVRDWIKEHKSLTLAIFAGTGAIVAGGIALKGLAVVAGLASMAITGVKVAMSVLSGTVGALSLLANPWVLAGVAIAGVGVYLAQTSDIFDKVSGQWKGFRDDTTSAFAAISHAISSGNIEAAWDVVTAYLSTEWTRLTGSLQGGWSGFKSYFSDVWYGILASWNEFVSKFKSVWNDAVGWVEKKWLAFSNSTFTESTADALAPIMAAIQGVDVNDLRKNLHEDFRNARGSQGADEAAIDNETKRKNEELARAHQDYVNSLGAERNKEEQARADALKAAEEELAKKRESLKAAVAAANATKAADGPEVPKGNKAFAAAAAAEVKGTFSGAVASMLGGGGDVQQQQLDAQKEMIDALWAMLDVDKDQAAATQRLAEKMFDFSFVQ